MMWPNLKLKTFVISFVMSLPLGGIFASLYITLKHGITAVAFREFDVLAVLYETPLYLSYVSDDFYKCLSIIGANAVIVTTAVAAITLRPKHFGTARWARNVEIAKKDYLKRYKHVTGPVFGKTSGPRGFGRFLTNGAQPHSLIVAPTRAGKGVGIVIPTLLTFNGSVVALDVKGELFDLTSRQRLSRGDQIFKFAPMDNQRRTHCYNPVLDIVAMPAERRFSETRRLAVNLIVAKSKSAESFLDGARNLFVAGVLACIERGTPTIGAVYDLFTQPGEKYKLFAELAEESRVPEVIRIFDNMAGNDTKIITSYTSVLGDGGLNLWADPLIKNATSRSDFSIYNLRRDPTTIYLCVNPNDLEVIAPLMRLFFQQTVSILQRSLPKEDEIFEVLFLLDEFKHLGRLEAIETAVTTMAGYSGRFMFIIQSLAALTGAYEQSGKENFLANTGVQVFMATADDETPEYISKAIGEYTFRQKSTSYSQKEWFNANIQLSDQGARLIRPEQIRLLDDNHQIVLIKGEPPMKMYKIKYYADRYLKSIFEQQKGPLPEPEPLDEASVQAIATNLLTGPVPPATSDEPLSPIDDWSDDVSKDDGGSEDRGLDPSNEAPDPAMESQMTNEEPEPSLRSKPAAFAAQQALLERIIALQQRGTQIDRGSPSR